MSPKLFFLVSLSLNIILGFLVVMRGADSRTSGSQQIVSNEAKETQRFVLSERKSTRSIETKKNFPGTPGPVVFVSRSQIAGLIGWDEKTGLNFVDSFFQLTGIDSKNKILLERKSQNWIRIMTQMLRANLRVVNDKNGSMFVFKAASKLQISKIEDFISSDIENSNIPEFLRISILKLVGQSTVMVEMVNGKWWKNVF